MIKTIKKYDQWPLRDCKLYMYFWILLKLGFTFLIILPLKEKSVSGQTNNCTLAPDDYGRLKSNCQSVGLTSIPQNLDTKIEVLDISLNQISTLNKDDLKNYSNLWGLAMAHLPITSFPGGFFQYTPRLRMLNISRTQITDLKSIPVTVANLNYTYCKFETMDLSHLINLKRLFLRHCSALKRIPTMYSTAPLEVLDLKFCDLSEAGYSQLAPFCRLRYFGLNSTTLMQEKYVTQCCGLRKWGMHWNLTGFRGQQCSRTASHPFCYALDIKFDENSMKQYRDCIYQKRISRVILIMIVSTVVVVVLVTLATVAFMYHRRRSHRLRNETRDSVTEVEPEVESDDNLTD